MRRLALARMVADGLGWLHAAGVLRISRQRVVWRHEVAASLRVCSSVLNHCRHLIKSLRMILVLLMPRWHRIHVLLHTHWTTRRASNVWVAAANSSSTLAWNCRTFKSEATCSHRATDLVLPAGPLLRLSLLVVRWIVLLLSHLLIQVSILLEPISVHSVPLGLHGVHD